MKNIIAVFMFIMPLVGFAQQHSMTASFEEKSEVIVNQEEKAVSEFVLYATEAELAIAREEAKKYEAYMGFETTPSGEEGKYNCTLTFNHKGHHSNVHKMLLAFGVEKFIWNGQTHSLDSWFNVFKD